jgi:hypothetical protein
MATYVTMMSIGAPRYADWQAILERLRGAVGVEGSDMMNRPMRRYSGGPMGVPPMMANPYANPYIDPRNQAPRDRDGGDGETGRLPKLAECVAEIVHEISDR